MSVTGRETLKALVPAGGAGALFIAFWLGLGVPLPFSALASAAGYTALFFMLKGLSRAETREAAIGDFIDIGLAKKTAARGRELSQALRAQLQSFDRGDLLGAKFRKLSELLEAIAADVEADPKDAVAAASFLSTEGEAAPRLASLILSLGRRETSAEQLREARAKVEGTLDKLILAHERHLARLQEDNIAELEAELDVLAESLGIDEQLRT